MAHKEDGWRFRLMRRGNERANAVPFEPLDEHAALTEKSVDIVECLIVHRAVARDGGHVYEVAERVISKPAPAIGGCSGLGCFFALDGGRFWVHRNSFIKKTGLC